MTGTSASPARATPSGSSTASSSSTRRPSRARIRRWRGSAPTCSGPAGGSSSSRGRRRARSRSRWRSPGQRSITTPRTCRPPSAGGSSRSTRRAAPAGASSTSAPWPPILVSRSWSSACLRRNGWRAPCAPAWRPHRPAAIGPTGSAPSACATATARFSTCARGSRGPRRARPRSMSTSGTSASSCPRGAELCLLVAGASYPRWEPLGEPRRQTVGAGSTLDLTAAGDV